MGESRTGIVTGSPEIRVRYALAAYTVMILTGVLGFSLIEGWSLLDSAYMTIITLSTVGYGEVHAMTPEGRVFGMILIVAGTGTAAYTAIAMVQLLLGRQLQIVLGRRRMEGELRKLQDHVVLCGFGRVGRQIHAELKARDISVVVIEQDPEKAGVPPEVLCIHGDATEDSVLRKARIESARGLITALADDASNVYVALSGRQLNPGLLITSRAESEGMEAKLKRAGADRVVHPYRAGARRMAITTLQPNIIELMDIVLSDGQTPFSLDEVQVPPGSRLIGKTPREVGLDPRHQVSVVAVRRHGSRPILAPRSDEPIKEGDTLLLAGIPADVEALVKELLPETSPES